MLDAIESIFLAVITVVVPLLLLGLIVLIGYVVYREVRGE